jgi:hypothetical protein
VDLQVTEESSRISGEARVLLAVINLAVLDAMEKPNGNYPFQNLTDNARSAMRFLFGNGFAAYCSLLGFNVHYMRRQLRLMSGDRSAGKRQITEMNRRAFDANFRLWTQLEESQ